MSPSFLGWDAPGWRAALPDSQPAPRSCLDAAAAWLLGRVGTQMDEIIVAVPGGRAGRRLEELLVERATAPTAGATAASGAAQAGGLWPPAIVTAGALTDRLLLLERPPATRLLRTLTWAEALRATDQLTLRRIVASPPEPQDLAAWQALAEELRGLHAALGAERHDFAVVADAVLRALPGPAGASEHARWAALATVQAAYRQRLAELGLGDPHDLRRAAIGAGRLDRRRRVVLVGVSEMSGLLRAALDGFADGAGDRVEALVFAPPERAADFDARGCVLTGRWAAAQVPLAPAVWNVADGPSDQAAAVVETLARWQTRHPVDTVTLGVPDTEVTPYLRARLAEQGVPVRDAQGLDLARTPTLRLLATLAALLERQRFADLAAAVRHPQIEAWLASRPALAGVDAAARLDDYQSEHLPDRVPSVWLSDADAAAVLGRVQAELDALLGGLAGAGGTGNGAPRPLRLWAAPIAALLARLTGESRPLDRESDRDHSLVATLEAVRDALLELAALPPALDAATSCGAGQALAVLERTLAGSYVPPAEREPAVELLGWLELPLDEAPLILTGFNEGRVPQPVGGPGLLRDELRRRLGMPDDAQRLARDVYALCAIVASGRELLLLTGRRTAAGDPLLPSRLLFHCADEEVPERLARWLPAEGDEAVEAAPGGGAAATATAAPAARLAPPRRLPFVPTTPPRRLSVTAFRAYLQSPYRFYLDRVLHLSTFVEAHELTPQAFGSLAHEVLEDFGSDTAARELTDAARITRFLMQALERRVALTYGGTALPAVAVQVEQLRRRLIGFADWQARRRRDGWRIHAVEWTPPGGELAFDVDGEPIGLRGRIDRIDTHSDGRWAVLDYKTSDRDVAQQDPSQNHRRNDGTWIDLQLPLYRLLVQPLAAEQGWSRPPELGYVALPHDPGQTGELLAEWSEAELNEAWDEARRVVRAIRDGRFLDLGDYPESDAEPVYAWIAGHELLSAAADEGDAEDEA